MSPTTDIFGIAFRDYLQGDTRGKILVDISISDKEELPVSYFFRDYKKMPEWERKVLNACQGRVLDVGAGAGSHSLHLQKKGHAVMAIDVSEGAVACMKERGIEKALYQDFFRFENEKYDTILFLMNGAGVAQRLDNLKNMLAHARSLLHKNGSIFIESTDLLYMYQDEDGSAMINLAGDYYGEITYQLSYREYKGAPFPWLFVDYDNLEHAAADVGLECELFYRGETDNFVARLFEK